MKALTNEIFINRAKEIYGDYYDYGLVEYKTLINRVTIICPVHGVFQQTPKRFLRGHHCKICGVNKTLNVRPKKYPSTNNKYYSTIKIIKGNPLNLLKKPLR